MNSCQLSQSHSRVLKWLGTLVLRKLLTLLRDVPGRANYIPIPMPVAQRPPTLLFHPPSPVYIIHYNTSMLFAIHPNYHYARRQKPRLRHRQEERPSTRRCRRVPQAIYREDEEEWNGAKRRLWWIVRDVDILKNALMVVTPLQGEYCDV